jgi:hypothetical protein
MLELPEARKHSARLSPRIMSGVCTTASRDATSGKATVEVEFRHIKPKFLLVKQEISNTLVTYTYSKILQNAQFRNNTDKLVSKSICQFETNT